MVTTDEILDAISEMNVMQVQELVKGLEDKFGITAAAPVAVAAAAPAGDAGAGADAGGGEEKTDFEVTLSAIGDNKINVIKAVREVTALGLREAKELVESAPARVKEGANKEEADTINKKIGDNIGENQTIQTRGPLPARISDLTSLPLTSYTQNISPDSLFPYSEYKG